MTHSTASSERPAVPTPASPWTQVLLAVLRSTARDEERTAR